MLHTYLLLVDCPYLFLVDCPYLLLVDCPFLPPSTPACTRARTRMYIHIRMYTHAHVDINAPLHHQHTSTHIAF